MSTSLLKKDFDINRIAEITVKNIAMMTTMHDALFEIVRCEVSLNGGLIQKQIAESALVSVYQTAQKMEENKCLN